MQQDNAPANVRSLLRYRAAFYVVIAAGALAFSHHAHSAGWPEKPVRLIVPSGAGGVIDLQARLLAESFRASTRQPFVVDNRPGAGTLIGTELVVASPADGYTALLNSANIAIISTLYATKFNPVKDLAAVSWVSSTPQVLIAHPSVPVKSVPELVALAKQRPGIVKHGVNTLGSLGHLSAEMLNQFAGINTTIVPFKSGVFAMTSLLSGEIDLLYASGPIVLLYLPSGKIRALAVTSARKSSVFPNVPTMNTFFPQFESENWYAMFFPANTPKAIVHAMHGLIVEALKDERMREFMKSGAMDAVASSPETLSRYLERQVATYAEVIRKGNIGLQ